jgi:DNA-binding transcriptional MerR regulator
MREGLLRPAEGGAGKGSHRRFDFVQVNVAAVFGQLRRFGLNIAAFRTLADLLQSAVDLGSSVQLHPGGYSYAADLANKIEAFRRAETVMIYNSDTADCPPANMTKSERRDWNLAERPAANEAEVWAYAISRGASDYDLEAIREAAKRFGPNRQLEANIYVDLTADIIEPGYTDEVTWLLGLKDDGSWDIESGREGRFFENIYGRGAGEFGSGIFVPLGALLRKLWKLKTPSQLRQERQAAYTQKRLAEAGIEAQCFPAADPEDGVTINYDDNVVTWDQIQAVLNERPSFQMREDFE